MLLAGCGWLGKPKVAPAPAVTFPGGVVWQLALESPPSQPPAFDDARAYVATRSGRIVAVDHASGEIAWSAEAASTVAPASSGRVVVGANAATAWALDADSGRALWHRPLPAAAGIGPVTIASGVVFVTDAGEAVLLAADDGHEIWRRDLGGPPSAVAASASGGPWIGLKDGRVVSIEPVRGGIAWTRRLKATPLALTPVRDRVFVGAADRFLYSLKVKSGRVAWRWRTGGDVAGPAAADARRIYFASRDATLRALDRRHGDLKWQRPLATRATGGPLLAGDMLILAGVSPELRGFRTSDGGGAGVVAIPGRALRGPVFAPQRGTVPARALILTAGGQLLAIGQTVEPPIVAFEFPASRVLPPETLPVAR